MITFREKLFLKVRRITVKVGSSVLASKDKGLNLSAFESIARDLAILSYKGYEVILVTSGAIAAGILDLKTNPRTIPQKQASAALGQAKIMRIYEECFQRHNKKVAQILLTKDDLSHRQRYLNFRNTLFTLLHHQIIPIINENDTVAVEEIKFGDNDNLAALISTLVEADILIILTDCDGFFERDPKLDGTAKMIPLVKDVDSLATTIKRGKSLNFFGTGGIVSKIQAVKKAALSGIPTIIANGLSENIVEQIFQAKEVGTLFPPKQNRLKGKKHWIAFTLSPKGKLFIDNGAKKAVCENGRSLLPSGITEVEGNFEVGDSVSGFDNAAEEVFRGLTNYSSQEIEKIKGLRSSKIEEILGYKFYDEVIHRDNLVLL